MMKNRSAWGKWAAVLLDACVIYLLLGQVYFTFSNTAANVLTGNWEGAGSWMGFLAAGGVSLLGIAGSIISLFTGNSVDFSEISASLNGGGLSLLQSYRVMDGISDAAGITADEDLITVTALICYALLFLLAVFLVLEVINILLGLFGRGVNLLCTVYGTVFFLVFAGAAAAVDAAVYSDSMLSSIFGSLPMGVSVWAVCALIIPYVSRSLMKSYEEGKQRAD